MERPGSYKNGICFISGRVEAKLYSRNIAQNSLYTPIYHMEERTGCWAVGLQPVFKETCINLHISTLLNEAMKRKE